MAAPPPAIQRKCPRPFCNGDIARDEDGDLVCRLCARVIVQAPRPDDDEQLRQYRHRRGGSHAGVRL